MYLYLNKINVYILLHQLLTTAKQTNKIMIISLHIFLKIFNIINQNQRLSQINNPFILF
jgi:hypothetical protein